MAIYNYPTLVISAPPTTRVSLSIKSSRGQNNFDFRQDPPQVDRNRKTRTDFDREVTLWLATPPNTHLHGIRRFVEGHQHVPVAPTGGIPRSVLQYKKTNSTTCLPTHKHPLFYSLRVCTTCAAYLHERIDRPLGHVKVRRAKKGSLVHRGTRIY